jgi:hypothetical protein
MIVSGVANRNPDILRENVYIHEVDGISEIPVS